MKVEMDIYKNIRQNYIEGESQRHIAKGLGISRQTVKKYCEGAAHPDVRKPYERHPDTITRDVKQFILDCFQADKDEHLKKQKHTAKKKQSVPPQGGSSKRKYYSAMLHS